MKPIPRHGFRETFLLRRAQARRRGFALITTVSILVLLALVAVGLLTLSTVTVRASGQGSAQAEARANARLALVLALGELQKQVGPDQRITASAGILDESPGTDAIVGVTQPHWTGVWDSWAAGDARHGRDSASDHRTIIASRTGARSNRGLNPSYEEGREDHFRGWLVSLTDDKATALNTARELELDDALRPEKDSDAARLVGEGALGDDDEDAFVAASLLDINAKANSGSTRGGRYAWWVADESTKARIMADPWEEDDKDLAHSDRISRTQGAGATGHEILEEFQDLAEQDRLKRAITRGALDLANERDPEANTERRLFHDVTPWSRGLLTDVREGGMKQDLNALLERPIRLNDPMHRDEDDDILYSFDRDGQEQVPIQDLAAYYQCYREVVKYSNRQSGNPSAGGALQINNIDFGSKSENPDLGSRYDFTREYTNIYRMPIPVKIQFMLSYIAVPRTARDRQLQPQNRDTHKLHIGMTPSFTMWNPFNVPIVLNHSTERSTQLRFFNIPFGMTWMKNGWQSPKANDLVWITNRHQEGWRRNNNTGRYTFNAQNDRDNGLTLYVGGRRPVVFQPGEVRIFSLKDGQLRGNNELLNSNVWRQQLESHPGWNPNSYLALPRSEESSDKRHVQIEHPNATAARDGRKSGGGALTFKRGDSLSLRIDPTGSRDMANGAALHFFIRQSNTMTGGQEQGVDRAHMRRQFQLTSRLHTWGQTAEGRNDFNEELMRKLFNFSSRRESTLELPVPVNSLIAGERQAFLLVSLTTACEVSEEYAGEYRGRRAVARPFLHSTPVQSVAFIDRSDDDADYHHGWSWWVEPINSEDEVGGVSFNNWNSFYGGGYTSDFGTSFCIQQEVPLTPPMSIAALSHATLSGYSLADRILGKSAGIRKSSPAGNYTDNPFANATATGGNGLFPRTAQAIGNSYAHPYLQPRQAHTRWQRHFNVTDGPRQVTLADHSYLANKALWDEYFFSSIISRDARSLQRLATKRRDRETIRIYDDLPSDEKINAQELAQKFFFEDGQLPNQRLTPWTGSLDKDKLDDFFDRGMSNLDGAEQIAAHLMVDGPFNVNSTSVDAWKALFASARDNEVPLMKIPSNVPNSRLSRWPRSLSKTRSDGGTPVGGFGIMSGEPWNGGTDEPSDPEQWYAWRSLTDEEIEELAIAMVKQVKERGPFLSLSEFINRRLDRSKRELSVKGALQAALDDDDVSINEGFRSAARTISPDEIKRMRGVRFQEAMEGPVAYGSSAYVDQADILRNLGAQLTPRGDCFVIRTYGDSLDPAGKVRARAWCEAVVQRVPEYLEGEEDAPHTKFDDLTSETNRKFGRPLRVVSFRWLGADEI